MVKTILILFCSALCAVAQNQTPAFTFADQAFMGNIITPPASAPPEVPSYYPTNIPGYSAYSYFIAQDHFSSASGLATWTNLTSEGAALDLTNRASGTGSQPTYTANDVNSQASLAFITDDYLKSVNYTSPQPHELWFVLKQGWNLGATHRIFDGAGSANRHYLAVLDTERYDYSAGTDKLCPIGAVITNKWFVLSLVFNGANSMLFTNNVQMTTDNSGANNMSGITLCSRYSLDQQFGNFNIAEIVTFRTNLPRAATGVCSNLFYDLTNRYAITVP